MRTIALLALISSQALAATATPTSITPAKSPKSIKAAPQTTTPYLPHSATAYLQSVVNNSCSIYTNDPDFNLFSETIQTHFIHVTACWKPTRGVPSSKWVAKEIKGTWEAANRFFHGEKDAPYLLFTIGLSEGGGHIRNNTKPGEKSYGWTCATPPEAQRVGRAYPDLKCPNKPELIAERLDTDPVYCINVTAAIIRLKMYENRGDFIVALMKYKYGDYGMERAYANLLREKPQAPVTELNEWYKYLRLLDWLYCIRSRIIVKSVVTCGCQTR